MGKERKEKRREEGKRIWKWDKKRKKRKEKRREEGQPRGDRDERGKGKGG